MDNFKSAEIFLFMTLLLVIGIKSMTVQFTSTNSDKWIIGDTTEALELRCTYTPGPGESMLSVTIETEFNGQYKPIVAFPPVGPLNATIKDDGVYLDGRVTMTKPTSATTQSTAIVSYSSVTCDDEKTYRCSVGYFPDTTTPVTVSTSITVKGNPSKPDSSPSVVPSQGIEEGMTVNFTCTGNMGKPAGQFAWSRIINNVEIGINGVVTVSTQPANGHSCLYNGTSTYSVAMIEADNGAVVRCTVEQEFVNNQNKDQFYTQTSPLVVYYKVRRTDITKTPNNPSYAEGAGQITLSCSSAGNPPPTYKWYNKTDMDSQLGSGSTYVVTDKVNYTGVYVCVAENTYNGNTYNETKEINIDIQYTTTPAPTTTSSTTPSEPGPTQSPQLTDNKDGGLGTGAYVGIAVGAVVVIIIIIIIIIVVKRRSGGKEGSIDEPPEKPRNNLSFVDKPDALGDKNGPFNNQIHYADLTFEDRPRSRKPLQLSEDSNLNHTQYAEVMMPRV